MKKTLTLLMVLAALCSAILFVQAEETETETEPISYTAYAADLTMAVGSSKAMSITYTANTEGADTPTPTNITYYSADEAIAIVSDSGVVTGVSGGTTTITADVEGVNGVSQVSCSVTVTDTFKIVCSNKETSSSTVTLTPVLNRNGTAIDATFDFSVTGNAAYSDSSDVSTLTLTADEAAFLIVTVSVSSCEEGDPNAVNPIHVYVSFYDTARVEATVDSDVSGFYFDDTGVFFSVEINNSTVSSASYYSLLDLMAYGTDWDLLSMSLYDPDSTVASITSSSASFYPSITNTLTAAQAETLLLSCLTAGTYTFTYTLQDSYTELTLLSGKVILTLGEEEVQRPMTFTDVDETDYFYDAVCWAVNEGVTDGISATAFAPHSTCTRAQVVTFLWRAAGEPEPDSTYMPFTDVDDDAYYYEAVRWAVEEGITTGVSATTFCPNDTVTRGQVVTFLHRAADEPEAETSNPFRDISAADYYYEAVLWAVENDITNGLTATTFGPADGCTRAQIVTFLYRYYEA